MYVYGGYEVNEGILSDFHEMQLSHSQVFQWKKVKPEQELNPGPLMRHSAVVFGDFMYVFGGNHKSLKSSNALWSFDFNEDIWAIIVL